MSRSLAATSDILAALYDAYFLRAPDQSGFNYWNEQINGDLNALTKVSNGFFAHPYAQVTLGYGSMTDREFATAIYQNVLRGTGGDTPGSSEIDYWADWLAQSDHSRPAMVLQFISDALTFDASTLTDSAAREAAEHRQDTLWNKVKVAQSFISVLGNNTNISVPNDLTSDPAFAASQKILEGVTYDIATRDSAESFIAKTASNIDPMNAINTASNEEIFYSGIFRIAPSGTDGNNCGTAESPCRTPQYVINNFISVGGWGSLFLSAGTYVFSNASPSSDCEIYATQPAVLCIYDKHVQIYGGYDASNGFASPQPTTNLSIIDGQNTYRGVAVVGTSGTEIKATLIMNGITIQNGLVRGKTEGKEDYLSGGYGAGLHAFHAQVALQDLTFRNNTAIGGDNPANTLWGGAGVGGGLALNDVLCPEEPCSIANIRFEGNEARGGVGPSRGGSALGGGFFTYNSRVNARSLTFENNIARAGNSDGGGTDNSNLTADGLGGGAAIHIGSSVTMANIEASNNYAIGGNASMTNGKGGAGHGGAIYAEHATLLQITDANLTKNIAQGGNGFNGFVGGGGAIMTIESNLSIDRSRIINNAALGGNGNGTGGGNGAATGGGLHLARFAVNTSVSLKNTVIAENHIAQGTGSTDNGGGGGALWLQGVSVDIEHCSFSGNWMGPNLYYGQAIAVDDFAANTATTANIRYTILANHINNGSINDKWATVHAFSGKGNTINFTHGLWANNSNDTNANNSPPSPSVGTFNGLNTMLSAMDAGFVGNDDYRLLKNSAACDQAVGSEMKYDLDNMARDASPDIGAYEYIGP